MRRILAAFLASGLMSAPALAAPKTLTTRIVDYGDMRCAFAVKRHEAMDSHIIAWADGFIDGYTRWGKAGEATEHQAGVRGQDELNDATILREHLRGYCIKHRNRSVLAAVLAILHRPHATATSPALPSRPNSQPKAQAPAKNQAQPKIQPKIPAQPQ